MKTRPKRPPAPTCTASGAFASSWPRARRAHFDEGVVMTIGRILDPTATIKDDTAGPGPGVKALAGERVGFRVHILWRSWGWVPEVWADELRKAGATVKFWRPAG